MHLTSEPRAENIIRGVDESGVHLRDTTLTRPFVVSAQTLVTDWNPPSVAELRLDDLAAALELEPEVILLGTGRKQRFPDIALLTTIMQRGIAVEVMETRAACRTFNVLIGERRGAVAAVMLD